MGGRSVDEQQNGPPRLHLHCGDLFEYEGLTDADVILVNSTGFDESLMAAISRRARRPRNAGLPSTMHKYRLLSKKGEGTFSEVLKAQSIKSGKHVAIKCMKNTFDSIDQVNNLREIQALRRLAGHANIIKLHEILYDEPTGRLALVFELMDMNVYEAIKGRRHYLPDTKTKHYMFDILKGLDHMHRNGIFHRDVKPENLLLLDDEIKLADLGSCRGIYSRQPFTEPRLSFTVPVSFIGALLDSIDAPQEYISTRWYRAPECLLTDGYYGFKMDLFAAGCVWFEIVALFPLFPGQNESDQIQKIHNVLGTPSPDLLASKFKRKPGGNASHMDFNFPEKKGTGIERLIPHAEPECVELMQKLLRYDPEERILARQALRDPYFRELHEIKKEISGAHAMLPGGSGATRSREQWFSKAANSSSSSTTSANLTTSSVGAAAGDEARSGSLPTIGQSRLKLGGAVSGADSEDDAPSQVLPPIDLQDRGQRSFAVAWFRQRTWSCFKDQQLLQGERLWTQRAIEVLHGWVRCSSRRLHVDHCTGMGGSWQCWIGPRCKIGLASGQHGIHLGSSEAAVTQTSVEICETGFSITQTSSCKMLQCAVRAALPSLGLAPAQLAKSLQVCKADFAYSMSQSRKLNSVQPGCRVVTLSQPLRGVEEGWTLLFEALYRMTWGNCTAFVYQKSETTTRCGRAAATAPSLGVPPCTCAARPPPCLCQSCECQAMAACCRQGTMDPRLLTSRLGRVAAAQGVQVAMEVLATAAKLAVQLNDIHFNTLMTAMSKMRRWGAAVDLAQRSQNAGIQLGIAGCNILLSSMELWEEALKLERTLAKLQPTEASSVATSGAMAQRWAEALHLLGHFERLRLASSTAAYNAAISGCSWRRALSLLDCGRNRVSLDQVGFTSVAKAAEEEQTFWAAALDHFRRPGSPRLSDAQSLAMTVSSCNQAQQWRRGLLLHIGNEATRNEYCFNAAMKGSQERWPLVGAMLLQMRENRVSPDCASISIMATSLVQAGRLAITALADTEGNAPSQPLASTSCSTPMPKPVNPFAARPVMNLKSRRTQLPHSAFSGFRIAARQAGHWRSALEILEPPSPTTTVTFHSTMHALGENSLWEWVLLLLRTLCRRADLEFVVLPPVQIECCGWCRKLGLRASEMSFSVAMDACQQGAVWQGSMDLLGQAMCTVGCASTITWNPFLSTCELQGLWQQSLAALQWMFRPGRPGLGLKLQSRSRVAKACARASAWAAGLGLVLLGQGQRDEAQELREPRARAREPQPHGPWERMARLLGLGLGFSFDGFCAPSRRARWQTAMEALQAGRQRQIEVDQVDFNAAVSACEKDVDNVEQSPGTTWRHVLCLLDEAQKQSRPDCITFSAAMSILDKARWKKALASYDGLLSRNLQPGSVTFNALAGTLETARFHACRATLGPDAEPSRCIGCRRLCISTRGIGVGHEGHGQHQHAAETAGPGHRSSAGAVEVRGLKNRGIRLCAKVVPGSFRMILLSTFPEEPLTGKLGHESLQLVMSEVADWPEDACGRSRRSHLAETKGAACDINPPWKELSRTARPSHDTGKGTYKRKPLVACARACLCGRSEHGRKTLRCGGRQPSITVWCLVLRLQCGLGEDEAADADFIAREGFWPARADKISTS
eukprot:s150_g24.t7